jgi:hypothetical protein
MLKKQLFKYRARKSNLREKQFVDYAHAESVLLLYESDLQENHAAIDSIVRTLHADGKQVDVVGFVAKKVCETPQNEHFRLLCKEQVGFWGKPDKATLSAICAKKYDLIVDLTPHFCLPLQYVLLYANARCRIGGDVSEFGLIDFAVKIIQPTTENTQYEHALWDAISQYLKQIKMSESVASNKKIN